MLWRADPSGEHVSNFCKISDEVPLYINSSDCIIKGKNKVKIKLTGTPATDEEKKENCTICFDPFKQGTSIFRTSCGHKFHVECLQKWLPVKQCCPQCLSDLDLSNS